MLLTTFSVFILCSLILCGNNVDATEELSGLLSRLYKSAAQSNRPLVVIIDRNSLQEKPHYPLQPSGLIETSYENDDEVVPAVYLLQSENSPSQKRIPTKHEFIKNRYHKRLSNRHKSRLQKYKGNKGQLKAFVTTPRSPVMKSLLRFKNEINCEANNECQEQCEESAEGNNRDICKEKCEENFECESEANEPCGEGSASEECDNGDKDTSTKGYRLVTDKPDCVRC